MLGLVTGGQALNLLADGIINGAFYAAIGASFGLILTVTGRFHFAWSTTFTVSAFVAAILTEQGDSFWLSLLAGAAVGGLLGVGIEDAIYSRLGSGAGAAKELLTVVVASLGLVIIGQNLIQLYWTPQGTGRPMEGFSVHVLHIGRSVHFTSFDVISVIVNLAMLAALAVLLRYTKLGRNIRAASVNPGLALLVGINTRFIYLFVFGLGSFMAGVSGVLYGAKTLVSPDMGLTPVLYALLVAFIAGSGVQPLRVAVVGLVLGIFEAEVNLFVSSGYSELLVYLVLFLYAASRSLRILSVSRA